MKTENLKEQIKLCLWARKLTVVQIVAECGCDKETVISILDMLDDEGILVSELFEKNKTMKYWVKRDEFRIKELILEVLEKNGGVATRVEVLKALPSFTVLQVDAAIKTLKSNQNIHSASRGVLKLGVKSTMTKCNAENVVVHCTDKPHSSKTINPFYDPKISQGLFGAKSISLTILDDGSLNVTVSGKSVILTPLESRQAYDVLKKVYGRAS